MKCDIGFKLVQCEVQTDNFLPLYACLCVPLGIEVKDFSLSVVVKNILKEINAVGKRHWCGYDFFWF